MLSRMCQPSHIARGKLLISHWPCSCYRLTSLFRIISVRWLVLKDVPFGWFTNIRLPRRNSINQLRNAEMWAEKAIISLPYHLIWLIHHPAFHTTPGEKWSKPTLKLHTHSPTSWILIPIMAECKNSKPYSIYRVNELPLALKWRILWSMYYRTQFQIFSLRSFHELVCPILWL